jgi:hypothetical protein
MGENMREEGKWPIPDNLPEGHMIIYPEKGGIVIKDKLGRNLPGTHLPNTISSSEQAREMAAARVRKAQQKIREQIVAQAQAALEAGHMPAKSATDVFASAAGMLFAQIVLNEKKHDRDRVETFTKLGRMADVLPREELKEEKQNSIIPQSILENAQKILIAIEYAKENPALRNAEDLDPHVYEVGEVVDHPITVTPTKKVWIK